MEKSPSNTVNEKSKSKNITHSMILIFFFKKTTLYENIITSLSYDFWKAMDSRSGREAKFKVSLKVITWLGNKEALKNQQGRVKRTESA